MRLHHKVYRLEGKDGRRPSYKEINSIKVVVNNVLTEINLVDFFVDREQKEGKVIGWSLLEYISRKDYSTLDLPTKDKEVQEYKPVELRLVSEEKDGEEISIIKISDPVWQMNNKNIDGVILSSYIQLLTPPEVKEEEPIESEKVSESASVAEEIEAPGDEEKSPSSEDSSPPTEEKPEEESKEPVLHESKSYDNDIQHLIEKGYKEFKDGNFRFLKHEERKSHIIVINEDGTYSELEFEKEGDSEYNFQHKEQDYLLTLSEDSINTIEREKVV